MKKSLCLSLAFALGSGAGTVAWAAPPAVLPPASTQLPTGAQVQAGGVAITQSQTPAAAVMNINQTTPQAIVNWQTFNVGSAAKVNITQPSSTSVLLNRVLDSNPSQIFGQIIANGQVFLTNPIGVYFAPGSSVDVGSFTATTHSIADADFLNGKYSFNRNGATGTILNQGNLTAGLDGYIALLAPEVRNQGVVVAQTGGTVAMAAGEAYELQFNNGKLTNVVVTPSTINTLVENGNAVQAPGGLIILSAQAASGLLGGVVKNSGSISATGLVSDGGVIRLTASNKIELTPASTIAADAAPNSSGNGGRIEVIADLANPTSTTLVDGTISAKGGLLGGNGGFVETSASRLTIADATRVNTTAPKGRSGEWLLDPTDFNIAPSGGDMTGATLTANLVTGNVTLNSSSGSGGTAGDINVLDAVSWSSHTLTLTASSNINVGSTNATGSLTVTGSGSLLLNYGGAVLMGMAETPTSGLTGGYLSGSTFGTGAATGFNGQINVSTNVLLNGASYSVINSEAAFVAMNSGGNYVMGSQLGFNTTYTSALLASFSGNLNGFGHVISGLNINAPGADWLGLFHSSNGTVRNLGISGSIVGASWIGAIAGYTNGLLISRSYSTAAVTGAGGVGGLVGLAQPVTISESYATGDVTGNTSNGGSMGGLVGYLYGGSISSSYATGAIHGASSTGGLVGSMQENSSITNSFATGDVIATQSGGNSFGGLVGYVPNGNNKTITKSYATGAVRNDTGVTGTTYKGGLLGNLGNGTNITISDNYWNATANPGFDVSTGGTGNATIVSGISALTASQTKSASSFSSAFGNTSGSFTAASGWGYQSGVNGGFPVRCAITKCTSYDSSLIALTYNGAAHGLWSTASNWLITGTSTVASFAPTSANEATVSTLTVSSGSVVDYDTASVGSLGLPIANAGTIYFTGNSNVSLSGVISGSGALTKTGTGTLTLSGANTYSGLTTVSAGTLAISHATGLGGTGTGTTVASGATLDLRGVTVGGEAITLNGGTLATSSGTSSLSGTVTLGADSTMNVSGVASQLTVSGLVSGSYALTKSGTGNLVMSNHNTFSGGFTIAGGTATEATTYDGSNGPFGSGTVVVQTGGTLDLNNYNIYATVSLGGGSLVNNATSGGIGQGDVSHGVTLTADSILGGAGFMYAWTAFTSNGYGLVLMGTGYKHMANSANSLTTIASGAGIGSILVYNNQALTIGQATVGATTYSGINSTGSVEVFTRNGDLTVSQNVITTSTSSNYNAPAINLRAGTSFPAGTVTGGDVVLVGNPTFSTGPGAQAVFYSGHSSTAEATALVNSLSATRSVNTRYNLAGDAAYIYDSGFSVAFRGAAPVTIYLLPVFGQSSTYGTAPSALNYCYSSSASSCQNVSYSGIPSSNASFTLGSGVVSSTVNVASGVSGTLALTGSPSIASTGFVGTTSAGTYALTLTPSLTLSGYIFSAGNAVNYTIDRKPVTVTNTARAPAVYDGVTSYASLANSTAFTTSTMVGSDAVGSVSQTASGTGVVQAGTYTVTPSSPVLTTGNANNYNFSFTASSNTVAPKAVELTIRKTYDGVANFTSANSYGTSSNYTITGMVNSEAAPTISSGAASTSSANAATYSSFSSNTLVLSNSNYTLSGGTLAATIEPKVVNVTNTARTTTYDGVSNYATLASGTAFTTGALVGSDAVGAVTQTASGNGVAQAGSYTVTPSAAVLSNGLADNYSFNYVATSNTVLRTYLVLLAINASKTFDGNTSSSVAPRVVGLLGTDSVSGLTQAYSDIAVGAGKTLTIQSGYTISDRSAGNNYQVTLVPDTTGVITALPVVAPPVIQLPTVAQSAPAPLTTAPSVPASNASTSATSTASTPSSAQAASSAPVSTTPASSTPVTAAAPNTSAAPVAVPSPSTTASPGAAATGASSGGAVRSAPGASSSAGVSVNTINSPSLQTPGLVSVLVPQGTATSGTGLVIALPDAVIAPAQGSNQSVSVSLTNNQALPNWIRYDAESKALVTTAVPAGAFPLSVVVTVGNQSTVVQVSESQVTP